MNYWVLDAGNIWDSEYDDFDTADKRAKEIGGLVLDAEGLDPDEPDIDLSFNIPITDYRKEAKMDHLQNVVALLSGKTAGVNAETWDRITGIVEVLGADGFIEAYAGAEENSRVSDILDYIEQDLGLSLEEEEE